MTQPDFVRFKEKETHYLWEAKMMNDGVIVRQCKPYDMNIEFVSFEDFMERFEESYV